MTALDTAIDPRTPGYLQGRGTTLERLSQLDAALEQALGGGGEKAVTRHHARGKLLPRERVEMLLDQDSPFLELSPTAALGSEFPAGAGVVTGIGVVENVECVIIANDPTVDGGAVNPYTLAKIRRAARIASLNRLPLVNLVESTGETAPGGPPPDGGIARDLGRLAADRVPTVCVVFGATTGDAAYLPALSDYTIMVRGHAKVPTVRPPAGGATNQPETNQPETNQPETNQPETGPPADNQPGFEVRTDPTVPAGVTGPADQLAEDERDGLRLARQRVRRFNWRKHGPPPRTYRPLAPRFDPNDLLTLAAADPATLFDPREVLARILDGSDFDEFKPALGTALVAGWGELHGYPVGVLATVGTPFTPAEAEKAVHFLLLANATNTSLLFLQHTAGAGAAEQSAPLVHAMAKSTVPHLALMIGGATAETGRTDEPRFAFSWPAAGSPAGGKLPDDGVIDPRDTRTVLGLCLSAVHSAVVEGAGHVGVFRS